MARRTRLIAVCDKCLKASCWHGIFLCDDSRGAGLLWKTSAQLRQINAEHSDYFSRAHVEKHTGGSIWEGDVYQRDQPA
jgi:hypothetical protein